MDVQSRDGTSIAVWEQGTGPAIVLVHGSVSDHTTLTPFIDELAADMATFALDRRGFGASDDHADYDFEREFEDVAAVVDAVAGQVGGSVALFGHSYGAGCVMGAAALTDNVHHLVIYEPGLGMPHTDEAIAVIDAKIAAGDAEGAITAMFVEVAGLSESDMEAMKTSTTPPWSVRVAAAPTLPREYRVEQSWRYLPGRFDDARAPTLVLTGSESPGEVVDASYAAAAALPNASVRVLEGHDHFAHKADPPLVGAILREFFAS